MFPIHVFDILATTKYQPVLLLLFKHKEDKTGDDMILSFLMI